MARGLTPAGNAGSTEPGKPRLRHRTLLRHLTAWAEHAQALKAATATARRRSPLVDAAFETIERDSDRGGAMLAGALSYRLFVFALPLAFFLVSGAGVLASVFGIEPNVIPNSVGFAGVITKQIASASSGSSNWWVALSSLVVLAYATRVLFRAVSIVHALAWEHSAASVKLRARPLGIFGAAVVGQILLGAGVGAIHHQSAIGGLLTLAVYALAAAGLWLVVSLHVPHADARWNDLVPGCLLYGVGLTCIALFNILILGKLIESKSSTYGTLGIAATLLLGFFFVGRIMVGAAALNATLHDRRTRSRGS
jgi:uncharacterized BrkB/YihY/UPF0761 family membrane protein